jgi:hypothetical protein
MITNQQIVETYLAYKRMKFSGKVRDDVRMMMPFYLMDASYQVYCKDIKDYPCKQMLKIVKKRWRESYRKFYNDFFKAFDQDQIEFITDQMDELEDYIHNKMVMLKTTVMGVFSPEASFDEKKILASILTSNVLSQMSQHIYSDMYRDQWHRPKENHLIEAVTKNSYEFACYFPVSQSVDITSSDKVDAMINSLCKEVMKYLNAKYNESNR